MTSGLWFLTGFAVLSGWATSFYPTPFSDKVKGATHVVRGRVGESRADWAVGGDGSRRIYTYIDIRVEEVIKGTQISGSSIVARELGGEKDGMGMRVAGTAQFAPGEDIVVLLGSKNSDGSFDVYGLMTGKYDVKRDDEGDEYLTGGGLSPWGEWDKIVQHDTGAVKKDREKWTLTRLRELIKEQAQSAQDSQPAKTIEQSPAAASAQNTPAPPLQNKADESTIDGPTQEQGRIPRGLILAIGMVLGATLWGVKKFRKK